MTYKISARKKEELLAALSLQMVTHTIDKNSNIKAFFFPQNEKIVSFRTHKQEIEVLGGNVVCEPFVLFGVSACDEAAIRVLDKVFLKEPVDAMYKTRREAAVIVTEACLTQDDTCFCTAFGLDPVSGAYGDVTITAVCDTIFWQVVTEKGAELTEKIKHLLTEVNECDITNLAERRTAAVGDIKMPLVPHVAEALKSIGEEEMLALFNSDEWDELQRACLTCGTCTFICPTCHCYDIGDRRLGNGEVERCRTWDSCIYRDFTQMAHGNPRLAALPRFRQRYMHKLVYFMQNNGMYACTGCGRCVAKCPVYINIVKVMLAFINARKRTEEATHV